MKYKIKRLLKTYEIKMFVKDFIKRVKFAMSIILKHNRISYYTTLVTERNPKTNFPKFCKNIKWYPGLPDCISFHEVGEYFYNGSSHYYRFKKSGMLISCWEISARKKQLEFWEISNDAF